VNLQGNGYGVFSYLRGYKFEVRSSHSFTAVEGKTVSSRPRLREGRRHHAARGATGHPLRREGRQRPRRRNPARPRRLQFRDSCRGGATSEQVSEPDDDYETASSARSLLARESRPCGADGARVAAIACLRRSSLKRTRRRDEALVNASSQVASVQGGSGPSKLRSRRPSSRSARPSSGSPTRCSCSARRTTSAPRASSTRSSRSTRPSDGLPRRAQHARRGLLPLEAVLSARRVFKQIVDKGNDQKFSQYQAGALGRLVDIALRLKELNELDSIFASIDEGADRRGFQRSRVCARKGSLRQERPSRREGGPRSGRRAKRVWASVPVPRRGHRDEGSDAPVQAARGRGDAASCAPLPVHGGDRSLREGHAAAARHGRSPPRDRHVLARDRPPVLRDGPVFAGGERRTTTSTAAPRSSERCCTSSSWVYVKLGDIERAQRALEVLAIAEPNSQNIADGSLLRGDLMLRAGQFDKARSRCTKAFATLRSDAREGRGLPRFDQRSGRLLRQAHKGRCRALDNRSDLPPVAVQWAREARGRTGGLRRHRRHHRMPRPHQALQRHDREA
jgi:hypothetical protein